MSKEHAIIAMVDGRFVQNGQETVIAKEELVAVHKFEGPVAVVRRGYGMTLNMGNYESVRFDVSIEVPCYPEDVDRADVWASKWCEERLAEERNSIRGAAPAATKKSGRGGPL